MPVSSVELPVRASALCRPSEGASDYSHSTAPHPPSAHPASREMPVPLATLARKGAQPAGKRQRVDGFAMLCEAAARGAPQAYEDGRFTPGEEEDDEMVDGMEEEDDEEDDEQMEEDGDDDDDDGEDEDDEDEDDDDEDDDDEGEEGEDADDLPGDVEQLREMVTELRAKVRSACQSANAAHHRTDHYRPNRRKEGEPEQTDAEKAYAMWRHEERSAKFFKTELKKRKLCRAAIVNRLGLALTLDEREQLRSLGFLKQEWFLAFRSCVAKLQKHLYTAENSGSGTVRAPLPGGAWRGGVCVCGGGAHRSRRRATRAAPPSHLR
jgi:hypothetical protein